MQLNTVFWLWIIKNTSTISNMRISKIISSNCVDQIEPYTVNKAALFYVGKYSCAFQLIVW